MVDKRASIIGSIVGDALGVPVEFTNRKDLDVNPVSDMREYGTYKQPKGTWSDDSSMILCAMENVVKGKALNPEFMIHTWSEWYTKGKWTPYGKVFDIGSTTANALYKWNKGYDWFECGDENVNSNGNGSLMRNMPISLCVSNYSYDTIIMISSNISSLTHAHTISRFCCAYHSLFVKSLINYNDIYLAMSDAIDALSPAISLLSRHDKNELRRILDSSILESSRDEISGDGYVVHSLEAMIWCLHNFKDFKSTVLAAVNLGEDTDTTACIVGGVAGLIYGMDQIPEEWINCLARIDEINELTDKFLSTKWLI